MLLSSIYIVQHYFINIIIYISGLIFTEVKKLREQMKEVYGILKESQIPKGDVPICDDVPFEFPLKTQEELQSLEIYLNSQQNRNILVCYIP